MYIGQGFSLEARRAAQAERRAANTATAAASAAAAAAAASTPAAAAAATESASSASSSLIMIMASTSPPSVLSFLTAAPSRQPLLAWTRIDSLQCSPTMFMSFAPLGLIAKFTPVRVTLMNPSIGA